MRTLKQIITRNLQSHKEVVIDLPKTGLIRFSGSNSNGKSVITKMTSYLVSGQITKPIIRHSMVNKDAVAGEIIYTDWEDNVLTAHIQREASATYVEFKKKGEEPIRRYLSEGSWQQLVYNFGFSYNKNRELSLQIVDDESPMLYLATSPKVNAEIINTAVSDETASNAVEQLQQHLKDINDYKNSFLNSQLVYKQAMTKFITYDKEKLQKEVSELEEYLSILDTIYIPQLPAIPDMERVEFYNVYKPNLPTIPDMTNVIFFTIHKPNIPDIPDMQKVEFYTVHRPVIRIPEWPTFYDIHCNLPNCYDLMKELESLRTGVCPTCGRSWIE